MVDTLARQHTLKPACASSIKFATRLIICRFYSCLSHFSGEQGFRPPYPKGQSNLARADVGHVRDRSCGGLGNSQPRMQIQLRNETATRQELNDGLVVRYEVTAGRDRHFSIPFEV